MKPLLGGFSPPGTLIHGRRSLMGQLSHSGKWLGRPSTGDMFMSKLTALSSSFILFASSVLAQTPPATTPGTPPAGDAAATGGGIGDYWWIILLVVIVAIAIWYFSRRGRSV